MIALRSENPPVIPQIQSTSKDQARLRFHTLNLTNRERNLIERFFVKKIKAISRHCDTLPLNDKLARNFPRSGSIGLGYISSH